MLDEIISGFVGKKGDPVIFEVERGAIKKFADAVGDHNPLFWDREHAKKSGYGSIPAPLGFFGWPVRWTAAMPLHQDVRKPLVEALRKEGLNRSLDGGIEFEFLQPVYEGDTLVAVSKIAGINAKEGKSGKLVISVIETSFTNQHGTLVALQRKTSIIR